MKPTQDSLLLRVSCLRTHQTVFNKENSYHLVYIQACGKSYCYIRHFKNHGLKITIQTNLKTVNYLDVTFNLTNGHYCPYRKPNNLPQYINIKSNHPPNIIKQLPASINRRISDNSCNEHEFSKAKPVYDDALKSSGYTEMLSFNKLRHPVRPKRNRQRNIIWYNPPFSKSV